MMSVLKDELFEDFEDSFEVVKFGFYKYIYMVEYG